MTKWIDIKQERPFVHVTGYGLQTHYESDNVLVLMDNGCMAVCTYDGESWTLKARNVCGKSMMIYDYLLEEEPIAWQPLNNEGYK